MITSHRYHWYSSLTTLHEVNSFKDSHVLYLMTYDLLVKVSRGLTGIGPDTMDVVGPSLEQAGQTLLKVALEVLYVGCGGLVLRVPVRESIR